jgi:hypothetical protein
MNFRRLWSLKLRPGVRHGEPPLGDAKPGGNVACYFYDPDYNVEFCGAMDTIENYPALRR